MLSSTINRRTWRLTDTPFVLWAMILNVTVLLTLVVDCRLEAASWSVTRSGAQLLVGYGTPQSSPQYMVFHLDSSYYRLNPGPGFSWGTSIILQPSYWSGGKLYQGGAIALTSQSTNTSGALVLSFSGKVGTLATSSVVTVSPPANKSLTVLTQVWVTGSVVLDNRPGEAFKPVALSSMNDSSSVWDSQYVVTDGGSVHYYPPTTNWVLNQVASQTLTLPGGTSQWQTNTVSLKLTLDRVYPASGWHTADTNPNDDNVLVWNSANSVLPYWGYWVTAY